ncbi:MAG: hypothetical protein WA655_04720 [Candidatus Korobacteraceae bacterium]
MRYLLCALLLVGSIFAQDETPVAAPLPQSARGMFYVDGTVYQYVAGMDYTVVAAAHSVMNHKFLAVKVRVYNSSRESTTVKPEDLGLEDAIAGHAVATVTGAELAKKMRRPYNWARFAVNPVAGSSNDNQDDDAVVTAEMVQMMRAMTAKANGSSARAVVAGKNLLYTDTPGALHSGEGAPELAVCDQVCQLRNVEAQGPDVWKPLQRETQPDDVQQNAFLANTIPPRSNATGLIFCPLGKLSEGRTPESDGKKSRAVRVTASIGGESFQFVLPVE